MWIVRELVKLVIRIAVIALVATLLSAGLALVASGGFQHDARIVFVVGGCFLHAIGGVGSGSNLERYMDRGVQQAAWGNIPGFDAVRSRPEDPSLAPGPAFFVSGLVLIAIGVAVV